MDLRPKETGDEQQRRVGLALQRVLVDALDRGQLRRSQAREGRVERGEGRRGEGRVERGALGRGLGRGLTLIRRVERGKGRRRHHRAGLGVAHRRDPVGQLVDELLRSVCGRGAGDQGRQDGGGEGELEKRREGVEFFFFLFF